jgi:SAM-dependent methyltransferase
MVNNNFLADRYIDEVLADHYNVDESLESYNLLLNHIENKTNFKFYFQKAFNQLIDDRDENDLVILDVGGGIGWTSALMAKHPRVKKVILLEPSKNKRLINKYIKKHFKVPAGKLEVINGTFQDFNLNEKVDAVVLCASLHHCYDKFIPLLFDNIEKSLKNPLGRSRVLIANDHVVTPLWTLKRFAGYVKNSLLGRRESLFNSLGNLRAPDPRDSEHWRSRKEIDLIIENASYTHRFFKIKKSDLCVKKPSYLYKLQWMYYYSVLDRIK